jgi:hypothetical protein
MPGKKGVIALKTGTTKKSTTSGRGFWVKLKSKVSVTTAMLQT